MTKYAIHFMYDQDSKKWLRTDIMELECPESINKLFKDHIHMVHSYNLDGDGFYLWFNTHQLAQMAIYFNIMFHKMFAFPVEYWNEVVDAAVEMPRGG